MAQFEKFALPTEGDKITIDNGVLSVPNNPIIPFIEGDGTGRDIWKASKRALDAAVEKAYNGEKKSLGTKYLLAKKHSTSTASGCLLIL